VTVPSQTILLVCSNPASAASVEAVLGAAGHRMLTARTSHEARDRLREDDVSLVLIEETTGDVATLESALEEARLRLGRDIRVERLHAQPVTMRADAWRAKLQLDAPLLQKSHDSVIVTDLTGQILYWSETAQTLFGYSAEEMLGQTPGRLYPDETSQILESDLADILGGQDYIGEWRGRRKDGSVVWVDIRTTLISDEQKKPVAFLGFARDVTRRKRAEERLRLLADLGRQLSADLGDVDALLAQVAQLSVTFLAEACRIEFFDTLPHRHYAAVRERSEPSHAHAQAQALRTLETSLTPAMLGQLQSPAHFQTLDALLKAYPLPPPLSELLRELGVQSTLLIPIRGQGVAFGVAFLHTLGGERSFEDEDLEVGVEMGRQIAGALERRRLLSDMQHAILSTERERRIAETFSRLGLAFASELNRDKLLQRITDEATSLTGAAFGAFFHNVVNGAGESYMLYTISGVPRSAFERFPMPRNTAIFAPTFEGRGTVRLSDVTASPHFGHNPPYHGMPEGHLPVRSYLAVSVRSRSGSVLGGLFFGHPETDKFRAEHERLVEGLAAQAAVAIDNARLYEEAQAAIGLRDEFLQVAAHELRTPTTSLKLQVQSLNRHVATQTTIDDRLREKLATMDRIVDKLGGLLDELLDVSRLTAGTLRVSREPVDLDAFLKDIVARFDGHAAKVDAPLHLESNTGVVGQWDRLRMDQILSNLLSNALKYGQGFPVTVSAQRLGHNVRISVQDGGIGIKPEDLVRIFDRFERAVSGRHYGGLGLGLYITRKIVDALGGQVSAHSDVGKGARFDVFLPIQAP
jgi:PAS domain S-box-containing protein